MIGPIDVRGGFLDRFPGLEALRDLTNRDPVAPTQDALGQMRPLGGVQGGAAVNIAQQVSQMLQAVGGGAQDDKLLQMLITLLVLAAMMQDSQAAQTAGNSLLSGLGRGQALQSYQSISISMTQVTWQTQYTTGAGADRQAQQPNLDSLA